jgi:multidrug efflux pump subunit AcrA (membrane-fusion protein)
MHAPESSRPQAPRPPRRRFGMRSRAARVAGLCVIAGLSGAVPLLAQAPLSRATAPPAERDTAAGPIIELAGRIVPGDRFPIFLGAGERVVRLLVQDNAQVRRGDNLVQLANDNLTGLLFSLNQKEEELAAERDAQTLLQVEQGAAAAALRRLEARIAEEQALHERIADYPAAGVLRELSEERDRRQANLKLLDTKIVLARARAARLEAAIAALRGRSGDLGSQASRLLVTAPFDGRVVHVHPHADRAPIGTRILELWDTRALRVEARVWQHQLALIREGQPVKVLPEFFQNTTIDGKIASIGAVIEAPERESFPVYPVLVDLLDPPRTLQVGMAVTVRSGVAPARPPQ